MLHYDAITHLRTDFFMLLFPRARLSALCLLVVIMYADNVGRRSGSDEYQGLMNAIKRHVDGSLEKLQTKDTEHQETLEKKIETLRVQNTEMIKQYKPQNKKMAMLEEQNGQMLKMLNILSGKKA